jgi:predicted nucleotidyltransferase
MCNRFQEALEHIRSRAGNARKMTREEILDKLRENRDLIAAFGVRRLGIFGSCGRDEHTETSDLDFLVEFERPTFKNYFGLKFFLEKLFGRKVDLVFHDTIKPRIRRAILEETVCAEGL